MNFSFLAHSYKNWREVLVIGKTIERDGERYHIVGMTLDEDAKLYIIKPFCQPEQPHKKRRAQNQRALQKGHTENEPGYLHCNALCFGAQALSVQSGSGSSMQQSLHDYEVSQLFFAMLRAGWVIPTWLEDVDWAHLQLVTLELAPIDKLPKYTPQTPITIKHRPYALRHTIEKAVTLQVGKSRSFSFTDHYLDKVQCHINSVTLIDVWKTTEEQFSDPKYLERFSPEELKKIKNSFFEALEQCCPKGMCYINIEYECSKDLQLQFYSKAYLNSYPETHKGSATSIFMTRKPDEARGTHGLPLKSCMLQTAVSPGTTTMPAELFCYFDKVAEWEETV